MIINSTFQVSEPINNFIDDNFTFEGSKAREKVKTHQLQNIKITCLRRFVVTDSSLKV